MFKTFGMQIARDGFDHAGYVDYWLNVHAPMSKSVAQLRGYVANEVILGGEALNVARSDRGFGGQLDGIAQLHFEGADGLLRMGELPEVATWFQDGPNFVGLRTGFVAEERVVAPPRRDGRPYKAIGFVSAAAGVTSRFPQLASRFADGFICSRLGEPTGSTNLPGLEVPPMDYAIELWAGDVADAQGKLETLAGALPDGVSLVAAVVAYERVIILPEGHAA